MQVIYERIVELGGVEEYTTVSKNNQNILLVSVSSMELNYHQGRDLLGIIIVPNQTSIIHDKKHFYNLMMGMRTFLTIQCKTECKDYRMIITETSLSRFHLTLTVTPSNDKQ